MSGAEHTPIPIVRGPGGTLLLLRPFLPLCLLSLLLWTLGGPASAAAEGYTLSKIVLSGEAAPDSGGAAYQPTTFFPTTHLNAARDVPFNAIVTGGSVAEGLWVYSSGVLGSRVLAGQPAPILPGATYSKFPAILPSVNNTGDVVFYSITSLGPGVFIDSGGAQSAVVSIFDTLPGTGGGTFQDSRPPGFCCPFSGLAMNDTGDVAFFALVAAGLVGEGIFTGSAGALSAAALPGDAAPATGGGSYASFGLGPIVPLNAGGEVAFWAEVSGGSVTEGIFADASGSDRAVALEGDAAPGAGGGTYVHFGEGPFLTFVSACRSLNDSGDVVFWAKLSTGTDSGIFVASGGTDRAVARTGDPAPGSGGELFTSLIPACSLNASGDVAFIARDSGLGGASEALYVARGGVVQRVVGVGDLAPETGGTTFAGFTGGGLSQAMATINEKGDVAFMGTSSGSAVGIFLATAPPVSVPTLSIAGAMLLGLALAASSLLARRSTLSRPSRPRRFDPTAGEAGSRESE